MKTTFETKTGSPFKKLLTLGLLLLTMISPIALFFASLISGLLLPALAALFNLGIYPILWIATTVATLLMPLPTLLIVIGTTIFSIAASCIMAGLIGGLLIGTGLRIVNYLYDMTKELLSSWIEDSTVLDLISAVITAALITPAALLSIVIVGAPLFGMVCYGILFPILLTAISSLPALPVILMITGIGLLGCASLLLGGTAGLVLIGNTQIALDSQQNEPEGCTLAPKVQITEIPEVSQGLKNLGTIMKSEEPAEAPQDTVKIFADHSKIKEETTNSLPLEDAALCM